MTYLSLPAARLGPGDFIPVFMERVGNVPTSLSFQKASFLHPGLHLLEHEMTFIKLQFWDFICWGFLNGLSSFGKSMMLKYCVKIGVILIASFAVKIPLLNPKKNHLRLI